MALVRALIGAQQVNVSPEYAEAQRLTVLDEPTHNPDGSIRAATRKDGSPLKPKITVAEAAAQKKAVQPSAETPEESK